MAHAFKVDDEIGYIGAKRVRYGKITGISYNSIYGYDEYVIHWHDDNVTETYECDLVDNRWFRLTTHDPFGFLPSGAKNTPAPPPADVIAPLNISVEGVKVSIACNHEWKTYNGFTDSYEYCHKCDKKKSDNGIFS